MFLVRVGVVNHEIGRAYQVPLGFRSVNRTLWAGLPAAVEVDLFGT